MVRCAIASVAVLTMVAALGGCRDRRAVPQVAPLTGTSQSPIGPDAAQAITPGQPAKHLALEAEPAQTDVMMVKVPTDAWVGRWTGPEGLVLDIAHADRPLSGRYALTITGLDGTERFEGLAKMETIVFHRNGREEVIRAGSGADTGLKWLAESKNCLVIKPGEGFCRDR